MDNKKQEHYKYLENHVNIIVKPLLLDILKSKTENVVDFITEWCNTKGREIENNKKQKEEVYDRSHLPLSEESENEDEEPEFEKLPQKIRESRKTKKKFAISAEAYGEYNKLKDFKPRVIKKNDEQKKMIRQILEKNFMFNTLEDKNQEIVIMAMEIKDYKKDDVVIKQGDDGEELFIVSKGKLRCCKKMGEEEEEKFLKIYESGEVFGELALMYNAPRAASIYADEDSELFSLDRDTFNHIVKNATIQKRQKYDEFLKKIDILSTLDNYEREKICDCLQTQTYKKDDLIINEGESGDRFYLIQDGTAVALKKDSGQVYEYKENDYFGELALLNNDKRKATIKVTSDQMNVAYMTKDSFKRLLGSIDDILKRNVEKYEKYVKVKSEQQQKLFLI